MAEKIQMEIAATPKYDWSEIPMEIAAKIRGHIELYDDYEAFGEICSSWRSAMKEYPCQYINRNNTQLPWLMLVDPDDSSYRRYYSLTKRRFLKIDLPPSLISPPQVTCYFSSRGWLISVTRYISKTIDADLSFKISLFNPFSNNNVTIEAPLFHLSGDSSAGPDSWEDDMLVSVFGKFAVSVSPNAMGSDDFVVAMTFGGNQKVAYWRLGQDDSWVVPDSLGRNTGYFFNLCFFRGEIYAIHDNGRVIAFGDLKDHKNKRQPRVVANVRVVIDIMSYPEDWARNYYLVESKYDTSDQGHTSSLLIIHRLVEVRTCDEDSYEYDTKLFEVFKLNVDNGKFEKVKSLGNQAIFVGYNSTFAVQVCANVDDDRGCKADCIYYTDDNCEVYLSRDRGGGSDMGIYSLAQGKTQPFYEGPLRLSTINPPMWIELSST